MDRLKKFPDGSQRVSLQIGTKTAERIKEYCAIVGVDEGDLINLILFEWCTSKDGYFRLETLSQELQLP